MSISNQNEEQKKPEKIEQVETTRIPPNRLHQGSLNQENVESKDKPKNK